MNPFPFEKDPFPFQPGTPFPFNRGSPRLGFDLPSLDPTIPRGPRGIPAPIRYPGISPSIAIQRLLSRSNGEPTGWTLHQERVARDHRVDMAVALRRTWTAMAHAPGPERRVERKDRNRGKMGTARKPRRVRVQAQEGRVIGATALITGSTVGAGILALPASVVQAGYGPSSTVLVACWMLLSVEAFLLAEVNVALREETNRSTEREAESVDGGQSKIVSLTQMAERTLGTTASTLVSGAYLFLSYTLLVAYLAKAGELLGDIVHIPPAAAGTAFAAVMGGSIFVGSEQTTDQVNRAFTGALMALFLLIGMDGFWETHGDLSHLAYADWSQAPACVPIAFLALVYHDLIPVVCSYLGGDRDKIRKAILGGSLIPLAMFLLWNAAFLSLAPVGMGVDPLDYLGRDGIMSGLLGMFGVLAIATSLIGTLVSMTEYIISHVPEDLTLLDQAREKLNAMGTKVESPALLRPMAFLAVLLPPLTVAFTDPDVFLSASAFAGAYGMTTLYGIVPPLMALSLRNEKKKGMPKLVPGGSGLLVGLGLSAFLIAGGQARLDFPLL